MKRMASAVKGAGTIVALSWLMAPAAALAQTTNSPNIIIPTLGDAGLASLAGILLVGGALLLSRRRPRK